MEQARVEKNAETGQLVFKQGDVQFNIPNTVAKMVADFDALNSGVWIKLAEANELPTEPFDKKLLKTVLLGIVQNTFYHDIEHRQDTDPVKYEELLKTQVGRVEKYKKLIQEAKDNPDKKKSGSVAGARTSKGPAAQKQYRLLESAREVWSKYKGQKAIITEYMVKMGAVSPKGPYLSCAVIGEGIKAVLTTKQPPERVAAFYMNEWGHNKVVEDSGNPVVEGAAPPAGAEAPAEQAPEAKQAVDEMPTDGKGKNKPGAAKKGTGGKKK